MWRSFLPGPIIFLVPFVLATADRPDLQPPDGHLGYSVFRVNLPGGRYANAITTRAWIVRADGTDARPFAPSLTEGPDTWSQFAGWSPDGRRAIVAAGWQSPADGAWEEENKQFRFSDQKRLDICLVDLETNEVVNLTAVDRVSDYNSGLFFWPKDPRRLGFLAMIDGVSRIYAMDIDGRSKTDLTTRAGEFAYGYSASPDGSKIAYHSNYQVYIANADGTGAIHVRTGHPFNFVPRWSPDGGRILFVSGEHYDCHPTIALADGSGVRRLADRRGFSGVIPIYDVPDFHGGSSDVPVWSVDGRWVYYTAQVGAGTELFRIALNGKPEQLTNSPPGSLNYHPLFSPDGRWLVFGSTRSGTRQLYLALPDGTIVRPLTAVPSGSAAMHPHWQPGT